MKKLPLVIITLAITAVGALISISSLTGKPAPAQTVIADTPQQKLEQFLKQNSANDEITQAYRFALENPQNILSTVKCYCGCIKNSGHKNNRDCFFKDSGEIDLMGLNCGLCVKTALIAQQMLADGKSVQEISDYVDNRWGQNQ